MSRPASATARGVPPVPARDGRAGARRFGVLKGHRAVPQPVRRHQLRAVRAGHCRVVPVFVALENGEVHSSPRLCDGRAGEGDGRRRERPNCQDLTQPSFYGNENEKPYVLESSAPRPTSPRSLNRAPGDGGLRGHPLRIADERLFQDQLLQRPRRLSNGVEALQLYRNWFGRLYCQPVCRDGHRGGVPPGHVRASSARLLQDPQVLVQRVDWIGPSRGFVDPVKGIPRPPSSRCKTAPDDLRRAWAERRGLRQGYARMLEESLCWRCSAPEPEHQDWQGGQDADGGRRKPEGEAPEDGTGEKMMMNRLWALPFGNGTGAVRSGLGKVEPSSAG